VSLLQLRRIGGDRLSFPTDKIVALAVRTGRSRASRLNHTLDYRLKVGSGNAIIAALKEFGAALRGRLGHKNGDSRTLSGNCIEAQQNYALLLNPGITISKGLDRPGGHALKST
jgi:hypothetical protein